MKTWLPNVYRPVFRITVAFFLLKLFSSHIYRIEVSFFFLETILMKLLLRVMTTKLSKMMKELSSDQPRGSSCVPCNSYIIMRPLVLVQCVLVYFSVLVSVKFFYCSEDSCNKPTRIFARFIHGRDLTELMQASLRHYCFLTVWCYQHHPANVDRIACLHRRGLLSHAPLFCYSSSTPRLCIFRLKFC